jgi:inositol phosphorylceramide mannosyltransferase catalytic subunit
VVIPRIIHHVWAGDDPMPDEFARYRAAWQALHPSWEHRLWGPADLEQFPMVARDVYEEAERHAPRDALRFRSDVARLEILHVHGGVYVDTDIEPLRPIDALVPPGRTAFVARSPNAPATVLTNAIMGAVPGHPWLRECIATLPDAVRQFAGRHIARMVGPWHITRAWERLGCPLYVTVLEPRLFFPQSIAARDRGEPVDLTGAYGWHRWATTREKARRRAEARS